MAAKKKFTGPLNKRIEVDKTSPDWQRDALRQMMQKLPLLFAKYGIAEHASDGTRNDLLLVLAMATEQVPGFKVANKRGPKAHAATANDAMYLQIFVDDLKKKNSVLSDRSAVHFLTTSNSWADLYGDLDEGTLRNTLSKMKNDPEFRDRVLQEARRMRELTEGLMREWQAVSR